MKALVYEGPWQMPVRDVPDLQPAPGEVVVAVKAVGVCGSDVHGYTGSTGRRIAPMIMGHEFTGVVAAVGAGVTGRQTGDRVVVQPLITCGQCANCRAGMSNVCTNRRGLGMMDVDGAYAEAVRVFPGQLYDLPTEVSWEHGSLVEPLSVALHAVNLTPIGLMDPVVILGAGTLGLFALLGCRLKGAGTIIVSDLSAHRRAKAQQMGADILVNPAEEDLADVVKRVAGAAGAPIVIEAVGINATARQSIELVKPGGNVTWIGNSQPIVEVPMQKVVTQEVTLRGSYGFATEFGKSIEAIRSGRVNVGQIIEQMAPLDDGPAIVDDLAKGKSGAIKVILTLPTH
jgi:L-iditol 2-dehydrogenase